MKFKSYLKRVARYIVKGIPNNIVNVQIVQKMSSEMFANKRILITGGGRGLGFYIAKKCVDEGAEVFEKLLSQRFTPDN